MLVVEFADGVLEERDRDLVHLALSRIADDGVGAWPHPVLNVKVCKVLGDGRSGGLVLHVELSTGQVVLSRVLKIDRTDAMEREWWAGREISQLANTFFAPVFAASRDVVDPSQRSKIYGRGAVVYGDAAEFDGRDETPLALEEVARDPARADETVAVIEQLFKGIDLALYKANRVYDQPTSLARMNLRLGPALAIRSEQGSGMPRLPRELFRRTTTGGPDDILPGQHVLFELSEGDPLRIEVDGQPALTGNGIVEFSRGLAHRQRLPAPALPCADPFAALWDVLSKPMPGRVTSRSHGDLNARNVLVVGDRPYLIDYAQYTADLPQQFDFAWLEVSLLRDVYAERDPAGLIRLQRALAVGSRLLHLGVAAAEVFDACRDLVLVDDRDALRVLLTIRTQAHRVYPEKARPVWWRDHLGQLLLSAHRTLKWPDDMQSVAKLHAVTAVAAVATEWLTDGDPFELWDRPADQAKAVLGRHLRHNLRKTSSELADTLRVEYYMDLAVGERSVQTLLSVGKHNIVSGPKNSGKTVVLKEFGHRLLADEAAAVPLFTHARDFEPSMIDAEEARLGVRHLILDDATPDQLAELRSRHPDLPILASGEPVDGFGRVELGGLDERAIEIYLWRRVPEVGVERLMDTLINDRAWRRLDIQHPRALALLADYVARHGMPDSPMGLHRAMLLDKVDGDEEALRSGETVAIALLDGIDLGPIHPKLLESGLVVVDGDQARFAEDADRDHLAALGLRREDFDPARMNERNETRRWLGAFTAFVELPEVSADTVKALVDVLEHRKARLLASASNPPAETWTVFVADQLDQSRSTAPHAADIAIEHLSMLREHGALSRIVLNSAAFKGVRIRALRSLERMPGESRPGLPRRAATATLVATLGELLTDEADSSLREVACDAVWRASLKELSLLVAEQIADDRPWLMIHTAMETLRNIGVVPTARTLKTYTDACSTQLAELDRQLRATNSTEQVLLARSEQISLLSTLVGEQRRSWYLRLRFAFGVDATELGESPSIEGGLDEWLTLFEHGSEEETTLAAHHLLAHGRTAEVLDLVEANPSTVRLLIAAAALGVDDLEWAENLVMRMLPDVDPGDLEGPAAVLVAVFRHNRMRGIKLALRAAWIVRERDIAERKFWPWSVALGICHGRPEEHEALLNEGEVELAIDALSSYGFLLNGKPRPEHVFGDAAKQKLLATVTDQNLADWAHAAATVGLAEAAPIIRERIADGRTEPVLRKALEYLTSQE